MHGLVLVWCFSGARACVPDVVLDDVAAEPVGEVEEAVVEGDEDVGDQGRQLWQRPPLHLRPLLPNHHACLPPPILPLQSGKMYL